MISLLTKAQLMRHVRDRLDVLIQDDANGEPAAFAIYTLSDPRGIRCVRYASETWPPSA